MKLTNTINGYILREMTPPFLINLFFFIFIFLMTSILEITNYIVNYKVSLVAFLLFLLYSMPFSLQFIIPMSVMVSILLTFLRMSSDNEVIALKASGISIYMMIPPVLLFCLMGCFLTGWMAIYGVPWGWSSMRDLKERVTASSFEVGLKERTFNDSFKDVMLYVNQIDVNDAKLVDVFIEDKRNPNLISTVVAPEGKLLSDPERLFFKLRLMNGIINQVNIKEKSVNTIQFETYDISLDVERALRGVEGGPKHRLEMSLPEMRQYLRENKKRDLLYYRTLMDYYKKFSIPTACIVLGLLALPLGFQSSIIKRSYGIILGLVFFVFYYILLSAGWGYGELGKYPPIIGMWLPNAICGMIAIYFIIQTGEENPSIIHYWLRLADWIFQIFGKR
jgi:lipopolysaccharide export system permease protein